METKMALTYYDLIEKLKQLDELTIIEILNITSDELVDAFSEKANDRLEQLQEEFRHETE
jgi:hypothetical protein